MQNLPRKEGIRGIFIPTEGYYFAAIDYCQLELCTLAQHCLKTQGKSVLADKLNEGVDCYRYLGAFAFEKESEQLTKLERNQSKIAMLGFPGGLSAETFISYAKGFGLDLNLETSTRLRNKWLETFPEMKQHLQPEVMEGQFGRYICKTLTGRIRGNCSYTQAANGFMQGLASDGLKEALWELFLERIRTVNEIHDETINEIKITTPEQITEEIKHIENIMINAMKKVVPDVRISVESTLTDRWYKEAEPQYDENSYLMLWQPEGENDGV